MRGFLPLLAAIGLLVAAVVGTGCSRQRARPGTDKAASEETPAARSEISPDEEVVFFPTWAHLDEDGRTWTVGIHGVIYEPEADSKTREAMVTAIAERLEVEAGTAEAENLDRRARLFLVDNERGQEIPIRNVAGEKIDDARFRGLRGGLDDVRFRLFDRPAQLGPAVEEICRIYGTRQEGR